MAISSTSIYGSTNLSSASIYGSANLDYQWDYQWALSEITVIGYVTTIIAATFSRYLLVTGSCKGI